MVCTEEVGTDTLQFLILISHIQSFNWCELSNRVQNWRGAKEFDFPLVASELVKHLQLRLEEGLIHCHF